MPSWTSFKPKNGDHNGLFGRLSATTPEPAQPHKHLRETTAEKKVPADLLLVVEVADSSLAYDLGVKVPLYARHGIPEVWVIDATTRQTRVFREPVGRSGAGQPNGSGYTLEASLAPHEQLSCASVVAESGEAVAVAIDRLLPRVG